MTEAIVRGGAGWYHHCPLVPEGDAILAILLLATTVVEGACPADAQTVAADIQRATQAYLDWDWAGFDQGVLDTLTALSCLDEPLSPAVVSTLHQLTAMHGARLKDLDLSTSAYRGVLAVEPDFEPNLGIAAPGSDMRKAYDQARDSVDDPSRPLPDAPWTVDGQPSASQLPTARTTLVQLVPASGGTETWYVAKPPFPTTLLDRIDGLENPEQAVLPELGTIEPTPAKPPATAAHPSGKSNRSHALMWPGLGLVAAATAGLFYAESKQQEMLEATSSRRIQISYQTGLGVTLASTGAGVLGGGLIIGALVVGEW